MWFSIAIGVCGASTLCYTYDHCSGGNVKVGVFSSQYSFMGLLEASYTRGGFLVLATMYALAIRMYCASL